MEILDHLIMLIMTTGLIVILVFFLFSTLLSLKRETQKTAVFLSLFYAFFIITFILFDIGHYDAYVKGVTTDFYFQISLFANAFSIVGIMCMVLFHTGFVNFSKSRKILEIAIGIFVTIWILLPANYYPPTGNQFKTLTYIIMSMYGIITWLHLANSFFKIAKKSTLRRRELNIMTLGAIIFVVYFVLISVYGVSQMPILIIITMVLLYASFTCYFLGIYLPKIRARKTK